VSKNKQRYIKNDFRKLWQINKYRKDKILANNAKVGENIIRCIQENITKDKLIDELKN